MNKTRKIKTAGIYFTLLAGMLLYILTACENQTTKMEKDAQALIDTIEKQLIPLITESAKADFDAAVSGKEEDYNKSAEYRIKIVKIMSDKLIFSELKKYYESPAIKDTLIKREILAYYYGYLGNQVDTVLLSKKIALESELENLYSAYRAELNGVKVSDNQLDSILQSSKNSKELEAAWSASKAIGQAVSSKVLEIVKLRNEIARSLGFDNFHSMSLILGEQDPAEIEKLFDELDTLTRQSFIDMKTELDGELASQLNIKVEDLMPWHYQDRFFQEAPKMAEVDFDKYYEGKDLVALASNYYKGIDLPVDDILSRSDLYEKPGKNQHAFCTDIDREGDVRVLCNMRSNSYWMNTILHELGHGVYEKYLGFSLPYSLRSPAHTFTTEAIAMMFGRFALNGQWIQDNIGISTEEKEKINNIAFENLRRQQLIFSRWAQVMYRFEKSMYENPDQDLNKLWWDLVEKYQMVKKPEGRNAPDYAAKIHIALYPCYYHNYLMGELLASQLQSTIVTKILKSDDLLNNSFTGHPEVGNFLKTTIFAYGAKYPWNDMIEKTTGEKLTAKYYAGQFVK